MTWTRFPSRVHSAVRARLGRLVLTGRELRDLRAELLLLRKDSNSLVVATEQVAELRRDQDRQRRRFKAVKKTLDGLPRYEHGSLTVGVEAWSHRWRQAEGKRVLLFANRDFAGSFFKLAEAINRCTDYAARLVAFQSHPFGYPLDLLYSAASLEPSYPGLLDLIGQSDVIQLKDETGFFRGTNKLPPDLLTGSGVPVIFTHYGGYARKHADDVAYIEHVRSFAARVALTPDLCFEWFDGSYLPHCVDAHRFEYSWRDGRTVGHSPSTPERKGTAELLEAVRELGLTVDMIHGVGHEECLARKARCNVFFDQAGRESVELLGIDRVIGWYGNSALEAAVHGIPTIAHLSEEALDNAARAGKDVRDSCAIINTPLGADGIRQTIGAFFDLSPDERRELSLRTRAWIEDFHSYEAVGPEAAALYDRVRRGQTGEAAALPPAARSG
ncbi:MAG TPA: hypothetical protein VFA24_07005 [Gaiellaceae bacterium]|nr:hypothetical protein [Gaiellaceae bacterium]